MSNEKQQIKEMFEDLLAADKQWVEFCLGRDCQECEYYYAKTECRNQFLAERLTAKDYRKQSENETLEAIDKFRSALMDEFLRLCCYNDYSKLTLLKIGDTIDRVYDKCIESMKGGAE